MNLSKLLPLYDKEEIYEFTLDGFDESRRGCIKDWYTVPTFDCKGNPCKELFAVMQDVDSGLIYQVPRIRIIMGEYYCDPAGLCPPKKIEEEIQLANVYHGKCNMPWD